MKFKVVLLTVFCALLGGVAFATDNNRLQHWHDKDNITWNYNTWTSDSGWETVVQSAFDAWEVDTNIGFTKVTGTSQVDVSRGTSTSGPCRTRLGCAEPVSYWPLFNHWIDTNIWFNTDRSWMSGLCGGESSSYSRYSVALHEIGHAGGRLDHSSDIYAIMYDALAAEDCRVMNTHDMNSMNAQVTGH